MSTKLDTLLNLLYPAEMSDDIENVLAQIQGEQVALPMGIFRNIFDINKNIHPVRDLVLAIQGVRRSGKSTLLRQIANRQGIESNSIFINFEDPRLGDRLDHTLLDAIVAFHKRRDKNNIFFFFDEIQNVKNWERWLNVQLEKKQYCFIITGSNSTLLSGKLGTALTGRHLTIELFPFSYTEFKQIFSSGSIEKYFSMGGFPRALTYEDPNSLLREYFTDIIERDVRRHVAARSSRTLTQLAKTVYESTGSETSFRKLAHAFDSTPDTVKTYVHAFEAAYLCLSCPYFTYSEKKSVVRQTKYYPIDLGLRGAIVTQTGLDLGKKLETAVFLSLRRKYGKVYYWRGKGEVDFVIESDKGILPIQVSWDGPRERHIEALVEFKAAHANSLEPLFISRNNIMNYL